MSTMITIDPFTEERLETFETFSPERVDRALAGATTAFRSWRTTTIGERSAAMRRVATALRDQKHALAATATREMGKPIVEAEAEVEKCAACCDFYAEHAARFIADEPTPSGATESYIGYRPLGPVLAVMPWNFPYWQVFRFAAPALMAGNVGILKHATNVSRCALEIERIFHDAGFPAGVFTTILVPGSETAKLLDDPRIVAVTLTGSEGAGIAIASAAGKNLKHSVLELGGSDAFVVLADADLDRAAETAAKSRFQNTGQSCIAAKRFIVEAPVYDAFIERFATATRRLVVGDPTQRDTTIGPMSRGDLRDDFATLIGKTVERGGRIVTGGHVPARRGYFYEPTIVSDVEPGMTMFDEETFGPAAAVARARDADHAVDLCNASDFGLGGNLWTNDIDRAKRLAARMETGNVFINGMTASDPRLPFGGVKRSGYGRELSYFGIREFMNVQTVWIGPMRAGSEAIHASE